MAKDKALSDQVIFSLAECEQCGTQHALTADSFRGQYIVYDTRDMSSPTHLVNGGLLCLFGHTLKVTCVGAVYTSEGDWLILPMDDYSALN